MLQIGNTLVSLNVVEKKFCCNLAACKGICCVEGDSGAPLTDEETGIIEDEYENICDYMRPEGRKAVDEQGTWVIDTDNDKVTPLINKNECAFVIFEEGITKCAIEKAWADGKTIFRKPISCHLYPIRLKEYADFIAVNYDEWEICKPALANGEAQGLYVYQFLREPLIRRFGEKWYKELMLAADSLLNMQF
ncbi:MAG: DUF3109 family protein [Bacteroidales bacterium]|nr:DUF3109 family protein [Bacteroidales bacterium]MBN2819177.1 DUF3109 family protein [Bacteroidales bacterium]